MLFEKPSEFSRHNRKHHKMVVSGEGVEVSSLIVQKALNYLCSKLIVKCSDNAYGNKAYSSNKANTGDYVK